ncbi:MAG: 50S ribosomal protein L11 methyltransferase [Deltaproteobacteria bacterium]
MSAFVVVIELPLSSADAGEGLLHLGGACGVETRSHGELGPPGAPPLGAGLAELRGYFDGRGDAEAAAALVAERLGAGARLEELQDELWAESWKRHFQPISLGRLLVVPPWPPWDGLTPGPGQTRLVLEPGLAFGTGSHETTSLCLRALDEALLARPGARLLDVGTGSGILAIAGLLLGSAGAVGTDNDPVAIRVARENAERNGVVPDLRCAPLAEIQGTYELVLANILANTLVELSAELCAKVAPGGLLFLSGILAAQADEVAGAFGALRELPRARAGDWMRLTFARPAA